MNYSEQFKEVCPTKGTILEKNSEKKEVVVSPRFNVETREKVSLKDLQQLRQYGYSVLRSSHLGNQYPSNLFLFAGGIPNILYDKNQISNGTRGDKNYKPDSVIRNGEKNGIVEDDKVNKVVPKQRVSLENIDDEVRQAVGEVFGAGEFHYKSIKSLFPETDIKNFSERLLQNVEVIEEVLYSFVKEQKNNKSIIEQVFDRYVNKEGEVLNFSEVQGNEIIYVGENDSKRIKIDELIPSFIDFTNKVHQLQKGTNNEEEFEEINNRAEGPVISNVMNVLFSGIIEAINTNKKQVYHCSGPDMVNYVKKYTDSLNYLYEIIYNNTTLDVPEELGFYVIPTSVIKFYEIEQEIGERLTSLLDNAEERRDLDTAKGSEVKKAKEAGEEIKQIIKSFESRKEELKEENKRLLQVISEVFKNSNLVTYLRDIKKSSSHLTQYDLIGKSREEIDRLLLQDILAETNFDKIKEQLEFVNKHLKNKS